MVLLYRIDRERRVYNLVGKMSGKYTLWGNNGAVARCAGASRGAGGPWRVTEADLLADLVPRVARTNGQPPTEFALLDYLVSSPELLIARLLKVTGFLKNHYNPIVFTFQEALGLDAWQRRSCGPQTDHSLWPLFPCSTTPAVSSAV